MKDTETKQRFVELRAQGWSYRRIADEIQCSKQTLIEWSKDMETRAAIETLQAMETEALRERYEMTRRHRLEVLASRLQAIRDELSKRDFADMPSDKLIDLYLKLDSRLREYGDAAVFAGVQETSIIDALDFEPEKKLIRWDG